MRRPSDGQLMVQMINDWLMMVHPSDWIRTVWMLNQSENKIMPYLKKKKKFQLFALGSFIFELNAKTTINKCFTNKK
jgi:hypothetical protein